MVESQEIVPQAAPLGVAPQCAPCGIESLELPFREVSPMPLQFKSFARPDLLKTIHPNNLTNLLDPHRRFLEDRGFRFPAGADEELDCLALAGILARPDEETPSDLVEALYVIESFSDDQHFDELLAMAKSVGLEVGEEETTVDLAVRLYLHDSRLLERKLREQLCDRRRTFESYRLADPASGMEVDNLPQDLTPLEADLDRYFESKKRGGHSHVIRKDAANEIRFLVQHGQTCKREPSRKGGRSTCTFFRPEKTDVVLLDLTHKELRINASSAPDLRQYRTLFGRHLFHNDDYFVFAEKYTLEPLQIAGELALNCRDIDGLESVKLKEVEYAWGSAFEHTEIQRAVDLFKALPLIRRGLEREPLIRKAAFEVTLSGERRARTATIKAGNRSGYARGDEAMVIERWLRARGFVISEERAQDAPTYPALACA